MDHRRGWRMDNWRRRRRGRRVNDSGRRFGRNRRRYGRRIDGRFREYAANSPQARARVLATWVAVSLSYLASRRAAAEPARASLAWAR